jgi:hypothetical protein
MKLRKLSVVLLALLLAAMAIVPCISAESIELSATEQKSVFITGDYSHPVTAADIQKARSEYATNFEKRTGKSSFSYGEPVVPEGGKIVAYGFFLTEKGVSNQYVGIAGDSESDKRILEKANEWYTKYVIQKSAIPDTKDASLGSASWQTVGSNTGDYYLSPYGGVTNNYELAKVSNDNDATKDWFAIKHTFAMEPGYKAYHSGWTNDYGEPKHDWSAGTFGNPQLYDWDPLGTYSGTQNIGVSLGGASAVWSWSYTQPDVTTNDYSSTGTEKARWKESFNSNAARQSTGGMKPGSSASVTQHSSGTYKILSLYGDGTFFLNYQYHQLSDLWNIYYQY